MQLTVLDQNNTPQRRLPDWLRRPLPSGDFSVTKNIVANSGVATVCQEARCPNLSECWSRRHATFMILGDKCTRRCHFCAVVTAPPDPADPTEPRRLAQAVARLDLRHVVITAVARDDLADEGAGHFAQCVRLIHEKCPNTTVEVLPADFHGRTEHIAKLVDAGPELYNHNLETVEALTKRVRPAGRYHRSLGVLQTVKRLDSSLVTKSGLMVGLGESAEQLKRAFEDLRRHDCDVLTVGQYLRPTLTGHLPVEKYYHPDEFEELGEYARTLGFLAVACGPFVRSSYNADEVFNESRQRRTKYVAAISSDRKVTE